MWNSLKAKWNEFETWFDGIWPGLKIKIVATAGMLSMAFESVKDFWAQAPWAGIIPDKTLSLVGLGLFAITFWLRTISGKNKD